MLLGCVAVLTSTVLVAREVQSGVGSSQAPSALVQRPPVAAVAERACLLLPTV